MAGRKIQDEEDARRCLAAARGTRGGLAAWAWENGVDGRSLHCWRVNLERRKAPKPKETALRLVELVPATTATVAQGAYRLHVDGVELEVAASFEEASLRRLIRLLKSC